MKKLLRTLIIVSAILYLLPIHSVAASDTVTIKIEGNRDYQSVYQVWNLINQERAKRGLSALTINADLTKTAMQRAAECSVFWNHKRPDDSTCFTAFPPSIHQGRGENIAVGQYSAQRVMQELMGSPRHRANILNPAYRSVGIGCFYQDGGFRSWVQSFAGAATAKAAPRPKNSKHTFSIKIKKDYLDLVLYPSNATLSPGTRTKASLYVRNQGWPVMKTRISQNMLKFSVSGNALSVSSDGTLIGAHTGYSTLTCSFRKYPNLKASSKITVMYYDIAKASITPPKVRTYSGQYMKPSVHVRLNGRTLVQGVHYNLYYKNNLIPGYGSVIVQGRYPYSGTKTVTFRIRPKRGLITSAKRSKGTARITWKPVSYASGYQVRYAHRRIYVRGTSFSFAVKPGRLYRPSVRAYKTTPQGVIYGKWSKRRRV